VKHVRIPALREKLKTGFNYMKPNSTRYATRHLITSLILVVFFIQTSESAHADNNLLENKTNKIKDSGKNDSNYQKFRRLGIYSGIVISDELDTGFGIGARLPRKLFYPSLEFSSSVYFWGATKDSLDVSKLGIEESLILIKSSCKQISLFTGVTVGYYAIVEKFDKVKGDVLKTAERKSNSFETFLTIGATHALKNNHSIFAQINYCLTQNSNELHILIGLCFNIID